MTGGKTISPDLAARMVLSRFAVVVAAIGQTATESFEGFLAGRATGKAQAMCFGFEPGNDLQSFEVQIAFAPRDAAQGVDHCRRLTQAANTAANGQAPSMITPGIVAIPSGSSAFCRMMISQDEGSAPVVTIAFASDEAGVMDALFGTSHSGYCSIH